MNASLRQRRVAAVAQYSLVREMLVTKAAADGSWRSNREVVERIRASDTEIL